MPTGAGLWPVTLPGYPESVGPPQVLCLRLLHGDTAVNRGVSPRSTGCLSDVRRTPALTLQMTLRLCPPDPAVG